jgi:Tetracyclin repressor-like, C-terminal domain
VCSALPVSSIERSRGINSLKKLLTSIRASAAPRQKCTPNPNAMCLLGSRPRSNRRRREPRRPTVLPGAHLVDLRQETRTEPSVRADKAAIYRRWSSKPVVVAAAIAHWREGRGPQQPPDTGTLRGDLDAMVSAIPDYRATDVNTIKVIVAVATAAMHDTVLAAALDDLVLAIPRQLLGSVLDHANRRGEIPAGRDLTLVPDVPLGLHVVRMITGRPIDRAFVQRVLDEMILPLATAPLP